MVCENVKQLILNVSAYLNKIRFPFLSFIIWMTGPILLFTKMSCKGFFNNTG